MNISIPMNYIKIYLVIIFLILFCGIGMAQKTGFYWYNLNERSNRLQGKLKGEVYTITAMANELFFLQKEWVNASLTMIDGDVFENVRLRYMAYGDEIIAYNDNVSTLFKIEKETVKQFTYVDKNINKVIKFVNFCSGEEGSKCHFYEDLYSGNSRLFAFHYIEEVKVSPYNDRWGIMRDSEYRLNAWYYLYNERMGLMKIQKNRRSFIKLFPENKAEIRKIIRKNKISMTDQRSLIQAFKLLDEEDLLN